MSLKAAFNFMADKQSRLGTLSRLSSLPKWPAQSVPLRYSPTSFSRKLEGPSATTFKGREFIITSENLLISGFTGPMRLGDRIVDTDMGVLTIREIEEMYDLGAAIIGYRVRTD